MEKWEYLNDFSIMKCTQNSYKSKTFTLEHYSRSFPIFVRETIYQDCYENWECYAENPIASTIEIPLEGEMIMQMDDAQIHTVHTGEVFILRPGIVRHLRTGNSGFCRKIVAVMSGPNQTEILNTLFGDNLIFPIKSPGTYVNMLDHITSLIRLNDESQLPEISRLTYSFLVELSLNLNTPKLPQKLRIAMNAIDTLKNRRMTAEEIADYLHMSGQQLSRLFKKHLNITLRQYIIKNRMLSAAQMLVKTNMTVKEISVAFGYSLEINFIADFSKYHGIPPMQYRYKYSK